MTKEIILLLADACWAGAAYDQAIKRRAVDGKVKIMETGGAVAMGDDLDALYDDWQQKNEAALAAYRSTL